MKKIILDLRTVNNRDELYDIIAERFEFPDYFGRNLDALYDCLTEICEYTCVGLLLPALRGASGDDPDFDVPSDDAFHAYLQKCRTAFLDAEEANERLCVIDFSGKDKP